MAGGECDYFLAGGGDLMAIANKALVWGLFAAGGTVTAFIYPALIVLFLAIASGHVPEGLQFGSFHSFAANWLGKGVLFSVLFLSLWHAAHRLRVVAHDFGIRKDSLVAYSVYTVATFGTLLTAIYLLMIE